MIDFYKLKSFLIFANPLSNIVHVRTFDVAVDDGLCADVAYRCPEFVKEVGATDYEFGVIVIYLKDDSTFLCDAYEPIRQKLVKSDKPLFYSCSLPIPQEARTALVILKCLAWLDGQEPSRGNAGLGMEVREVIDLRKRSDR